MKTSKLIILFAFCAISNCLVAQDEKVILSSEDARVKTYLVSYLVRNGEAKSTGDTTSLFTRDLCSKNSKKSAITIASFGLMASHSREFIFIKASDKVEIADPNNFGDYYLKLGALLTKYEGLLSLSEIEKLNSEVIKISKKNDKSLPFYK